MGRGDPLREAHPRSAGVREYDAGELSPGPEVQTDEGVLDWVARDAETALHPSCTCRMGVDELAVVDPRRCASAGSTGSGSWTRP